MAEPVTNVLILSGTASAINYIKSLASDPSIRLHVTDTDPYCPGLYARGVVPAWLPRARATTSYRTALDRLLTEREISVLIPTSDYDVEGVVRYLHDGWSPRASLFRPRWQAFQNFAHKGRLMATVRQTLANVVPMTWSPSEPGSQIPCPVVVKPTAESGGKGVSIVKRTEDLAAALARARAVFGNDYIVQEFVPGRTHIVSMVYDQAGRLVISVSMRSHLTFFTWGGGGCAGEISDDHELQRLSSAVVAAGGGWTGPINLEWRRHEDTGRYYLMEANCRLNGYSYLTTMNGICLPRVVLSLLTGAPLPRLELPPPERRRNFVLGFRESAVEQWVVRDNGSPAQA
jgi:predicted ATP-grasp superfamily ATP-dependent carboligase